jgi:hypothetical protein
MAERKTSTPNTRAADAKRHVSHVKRRYKVDLNKKRKILPGEMEGIADTVVVLKIAGYSRSQMAKVIGISKGQVKEILEQPDVTERIVNVRNALPQAALDLLQGYMIEAVQAIVDVMRTTPESKYVLQAAGEILDRAGLPKASKQERHNVNEDRMTFTDDGLVEQLRRAPVHVQEQAATLIEQLEGLLTDSANSTENEEQDETAS